MLLWLTIVLLVYAVSQNCKAASREFSAWKVRASFSNVCIHRGVKSCFQEALKTTVACKTCGQLPRAPFMCDCHPWIGVPLLITPHRLQCGHVHCFDCLKGYLESATRLFMTTHSRYQAPSEEYVQALRDPFRDPNLYLDAARWIRDNRTPSFQCTHCHEPLNRSPVHAFYLRSVICALDQEADIPTASSSNGDPWSKDFFDRHLLF